METPTIKERAEFLSYYKFEKAIVALTKENCDQIDMCIHDFNHLIDVPDEFKIDCCVMQFDPLEKYFYCADTSVKERVCINKLSFLYKYYKVYHESIR
jgi:hypothetical protein